MKGSAEQAPRPWEGLVIPYRGTNRLAFIFSHTHTHTHIYPFLLHPDRTGFGLDGHVIGVYRAGMIPSLHFAFIKLYGSAYVHGMEMVFFGGLWHSFVPP